MPSTATLAFLRTPPFPGQRAAPLSVPLKRPEREPGSALAEVAEALAAALKAARVGGAFWGAQPALPAGRDILIVPDSAAQARAVQDRAAAAGEAARCCLIGPFAARHGIPGFSALCDPWHLVAQASRVIAGGGAELAAVAMLAGVTVEVIGAGPWSGQGTAAAVVAQALLHEGDLRDPFTGRPLDPLAAVELLAEWRRLIDSNRPIAAVYGVAHWKRVTADPLLWDGYDGPRHRSARMTVLPRGAQALAWKSRTAPGLPAALAARGVALGEIEDGFIRSTGLGADCVPPLSLIVDSAGVYFDPSGPSDLERILAEAEIGPALQARAAALRARLVAAGIAKYGRASEPVALDGSGRRRVLVPGQVADDRSILTGAGGIGNLELLQRARELEPDAWIIYKPHPDVEAGHRKGHIPDAVVLTHADEIDRTSAIAPLLGSVEAVHTLTSLAGFEALMRGKAVTTHGVPFYAGWGLTRDLGTIPPRRGRRRTLDELVAATLILYPRYLDPVTRLPCPVEILVDRLESDRAKVSSSLVVLRRVQGRVSKVARQVGRNLWGRP